MSKSKKYTYKEPLSSRQYVFLKTVSNILILLGIGFLFMAFGPVLKDEIGYRYMQAKSQEFTLEDESAQKDSIFARLLTTTPIKIDPVNTDFSLVIERIGVNAPIVIDVPVTDQEAYLEALNSGVAHASVTNYPSSEPGNTYMFAHASTNFWRLGEYAGVFNLLRKLEVDDRVHVFYKGDQYVYEVVNKEILKGWNTYPITRPVIEPTLTLQTCDPPGTTLNRLVVTSKLVEIK